MLTLGSLFDGSGGFPLAGSLCGIEPVWAAEIEPYPIAVTTSRFPLMEHLGSVTEISGAEVEPVDIITFGSPCQDLSVAGKRAGLKHEDNGDDETTRSGLFMEAVRIIKEMREKTNGEYPKYAIWENVPGAFSSNKGEDFRVVLEELIKIVEPTAKMPPCGKNGWPYADCYMGAGWSLAYRTFDAQYWGVPQRRRRIYLILDLRGESAQKVLFEREGLRGYLAEGRTPWQSVAGDAENCVGVADREGTLFQPMSLMEENWAESNVKNSLRAGESKVSHAVVCATGLDIYNLAITGDKAASLTTATGQGASNTGSSVMVKERERTAMTWDARGNGDGKICNTLTGDHENRITDYTSVVVEPKAAYWDGSQVCGTLAVNNANGAQRIPDKENFNCVIAIDRAFFNQGQNAQYDPQLYTDGTNPTLVARGPNAVAVRYIVRRLTPVECARLQGFPDRWGDIDPKEDFADEEYRFWRKVRNTHEVVNGKPAKVYNKKQMLAWYNKLHTDSAEYKMWGNGIALPCALYVMQGIVEAEVRADGQ